MWQYVAVFAFIGILVASSFLSYQIGHEQASIPVNNGFTPNNQTGVAPYSFLIFTDGTYYYSKSGSSGAVAYGGPNNAGTGCSIWSCGTNASGLIQLSINNEPAYGGAIDVGSGNFIIQYSIILTNLVSIIGSGVNSTVFTAQAPLNAPVFSTNTGTAGIYGDILENFKIEGSQDANSLTSGIVVTLNSGADPAMRIDNVFIHDLKYNALSLYVSFPFTDALAIVTNSRILDFAAGTTGTALYTDLADSEFIGDYFYSTSTVNYTVWTSAGTNTFDTDYIGQGNYTQAEVYIDGTAAFSNTIIDSATGYCLKFGGGISRGNLTFTGGEITDCSESSDNGFASINISPTASNGVSGVLFNGVKFFNLFANRPAAVIYATTTAAKNIQFVNSLITPGDFHTIVPITSNGVGLYVSQNVNWFNNIGFNPVGKITDGWSKNLVGLAGNTTLPVTSGNIYTVSGVSVSLTCTGGGTVGITLKDTSGNTFNGTPYTCSTLPTTYWPPGYTLTITNSSDFTAFPVFGN